MSRDFGRNYTGEIKSWWENGQLCTLQSYKRGVPHGKWGIWSTNGENEVLGTYDNAKPHSGSFRLTTKGDSIRSFVRAIFKSGAPQEGYTLASEPFTGTVIIDEGANLEYSFKDGRPIDLPGQ